VSMARARHQKASELTIPRRRSNRSAMGHKKGLIGVISLVGNFVHGSIIYYIKSSFPF